MSHDPDSLDDELNRLLSSQQAEITSDDPLIQAATRLSSAPRPTLSPEASARIRAAYIAAAPQGAPLRFVRRASLRRVSFAATLLLFVVGAIFATQIGTRLFQSPPAPTSMDVPQVSPSELPLLQPTTSPILPTMTPTEMAEITPTMPPTLEGTLPVTVILEGPVQAIKGNTLTIFGLTVALSPTDPILSAIRTGDLLRVEGDISTGSGVITAVRVTVIDVEININPTNSEVWRDPGNCGNPPPAWAPANDWRRRCQGNVNPNNSGEQDTGTGDDDDDD
jgi:hypothetical protein